MATATKERPRRGAKGKGKPERPMFDLSKAELDIAVEFGGVSIGDETARLGISVKRENLNLDAADGALCGRRLTGIVVCHPVGDDAKQTYWLDGYKFSLAGSFDVKGYRVSRKLIAAGLTWNLGSIKVDDIAHFAKQSGRLIVEKIEQLDDAGEGEAESDEGDDEGEE